VCIHIGMASKMAFVLAFYIALNIAKLYTFITVSPFGRTIIVLGFLARLKLDVILRWQTTNVVTQCTHSITAPG